MNIASVLFLFPVISLFVERALEMIDLLIVRTIFPLWRFKPVPAPGMIIRFPPGKPARPNATEGSVKNEGDQGSGNDVNASDDMKSKIVHTMGASEIEMKMDTYEQVSKCQNQEIEIYYRQLIYYLTRYGLYLGEAMGITDKDVSLWNMPIKWSLSLERCIAGCEKITDKEPYSSNTIRDDLNFDKRKSPTDIEHLHTLLTRLEVLVDYCYLRNQRTHMIFSLWKQRVYSLLGMVIGIIIVYIMYPLLPEPFVSLGNLPNAFKTALPYLNGDTFNHVLVLVTGAGVGLGSQPVHEFLYRGSGASPVSRPHRITPVEFRNAP